MVSGLRGAAPSARHGGGAGTDLAEDLFAAARRARRRPGRRLTRQQSGVGAGAAVGVAGRDSRMSALAAPRGRPSVAVSALYVWPERHDDRRRPRNRCAPAWRPGSSSAAGSRRRRPPGRTGSRRRRSAAVAAVARLVVAPRTRPGSRASADSSCVVAGEARLRFVALSTMTDDRARRRQRRSAWPAPVSCTAAGCPRTGAAPRCSTRNHTSAVSSVRTPMNTTAGSGAPALAVRSSRSSSFTRQVGTTLTGVSLAGHAGNGGAPPCRCA